MYDYILYMNRIARGNLDQNSAKNQPFVRGLAPIWGFWWKCCTKSWFEKLAREVPALYGEPAPGIRIHISIWVLRNYFSWKGVVVWVHAYFSRILQKKNKALGNSQLGFNTSLPILAEWFKNSWIFNNLKMLTSSRHFISSWYVLPLSPMNFFLRWGELTNTLNDMHTHFFFSFFWWGA